MLSLVTYVIHDYGSLQRCLWLHLPNGLPLISAWIIKYIHIIGPFVRDSINDSPHKGPVMSKPPGWASVLVTGLSMSVRVCFWLQKYLFAFARSVQKLLSVLGYTQSLWIISIMPKLKNINSFFLSEKNDTQRIHSAANSACSLSWQMTVTVVSKCYRICYASPEACLPGGECNIGYPPKLMFKSNFA